jgi:hypothetical protein
MGRRREIYGSFGKYIKEGPGEPDAIIGLQRCLYRP